ncbi:MAG: Asp23/Gls24 family envelope stress response protein [Mogibacterium sp.]|nr:Asp23/Gls24 family envelope stress response protein [Mogibacterium sp.]
MNDEARLFDIIEKQVLSFDDVSRFDEASLTEKMLSAGRAGSGIRISDDDDDLIITLDIIVYYGVNIPQLCYDIQVRLRREITAAAGIDVKAVNINVEGIDERITI